MLNLSADLRCPDDPKGRTYRQINAERSHTIPVGALVEFGSGAQMFVVCHGRDCDQTPLYWLSHDQDDTDNLYWVGGYPEEALRMIR